MYCREQKSQMYFYRTAECCREVFLPRPALAGAGPNARPRRGALLSGCFITSSRSVNRAIRPWQGAHIKPYHENRARLLTFDNRGYPSLVLTRPLFVNNEIYKPFLLNSRGQVVSGKNEQST